LNKPSTPTKVSTDLSEKIYANTFINPIYFDIRARDESFANRENAIVHMCKEAGTVMQEINCYGVKWNARNKNKRKGLSMAGDGNIGNIQDSTIHLQMIGCKRVHSGTREHTDNISMNLIGAHYNVSASHPSMFARFSFQKSLHTEKVATLTC